MPSPTSCVRCSAPLPADSVGELCPGCLSDTAGRGSDTPHSARPAGTVTAARDGATGTAPGGSGRHPPEPGETADAAPAHPRDRLPAAPPGYDLLRPLGHGGMGDVYLARELAADRLVAMKFLRSPRNPAAVDRFLVEVRALARIDHPHIVRVLATDFARPDPFFTMEYAPGGTLAGRVEAGGPLPPAEAARVGAAVARAVAAAHAADVLHRDLKPGNILLAEDGTPRVSDFGLAKRTDRDDGLTTGSGPLGTFGYMPPEQVSSGRGDPGPPADVYGLGATLYHLLTGRPPFPGRTQAEVIVRVEAARLVRPRAVRADIPPGLEAVVVRCLEKDPGRRYPTAAALADDLDRFLAGETPEAPELTRWRRLRRWARRHRGRLAAAGAAVLVGVGLVAAGAATTPSPPPPPPDPLVEINAALLAGEPVTLVGPTGMPRWHDWLHGAAALAPSDVWDGTVGFQTGRTCLLALAPDPRVDRYRIEAEVCHERLNAPDGCVGLFVGYEQHHGANGETVHRFVGAEFGHLRIPGEKADPALAARHALRVYDTVLWHRRPGDSVYPQQRHFRYVEFTPVNTKNQWRGVAAEVSPDGVTFFLRVEAGGEKATDWVVAAALGKAALEGHRQAQQSVLDRALGGPRVHLGPWAPRRPVGLYARASTVSFRNVVITPNPGVRRD